MNVKRLLGKIATGLLLSMGSTLAIAAPPLITSVTQIAVPVRNEIVSTSYVGSSVTALQNGLAAETTARINADVTLTSITNGHTSRLNALDISTDALKVQIDAVAASTGVTQIVAGTNISIDPLDGKGVVTINSAGLTEVDPVAGAVNGLLKADGAGSISAAVAGADYLVSYTETDPIAGAVNGLIKADGAGNISAATAGVDYLTSYTETDPIVGGVSGIVKADGVGNISSATAGTDYLTPTGDGSGLTGVVATGIGYPFQTSGGVGVYGSSLSVGVELVNGYPAFFWRAPSGKMVLGCNSSNGECGSTDVDSEGIAIALPSSNWLSRVKGDGMYLAQSLDTGKRNWSVGSSGFYYQNYRGASAPAFKVFEVVAASSKTIVNTAFQYIDGNESAGKVLSSDASGNASWQTVSAGDVYLASTQTFTGANTFKGITTLENGSLGYAGLVYRDIGDASGGGNLGIYGLTGAQNFFASNAYYDGSNWRISKAGGASLLQFNNGSGAGYNGGRFTIYISTARAADETLGNSEMVNFIGLTDTNGQLIPMSKFYGQIKSIGSRFPSLVLEDEGDNNGIMSLGGHTGIFTGVANNLYYDYTGATWKHSNDGGASLIYADISTEATGGYLSVRTAATQAAGTAATLNEVLTVKNSSVTVTGIISATSFDLGRELITTNCASAVTCIASCTGSKKTLGGSCYASPQVSPLDGTFSDTAYTCNAGSSANITAEVICANFE